MPRATKSPLIIYAVASRHLVAIDPEQSACAWVFPRPEADYDLLGLNIAGAGLLSVDLGGIVELIDAAGKVTNRLSPQRREQLPQTAPAAFAATAGQARSVRFIARNTDGQPATWPAPVRLLRRKFRASPFDASTPACTREK